MKRSVILALIAIGVAVAFWPRSRGGPRTGEWSGVTSQGLPIRFVVGDTPAGPVIRAWSMRLDLSCETSGRVLHGGVLATIPVPIHERRFLSELKSPFRWQRWGGRFVSDEEVRGDLISTWPVLIGTAFENLAAEKCTTRDLRWSAKPGAGDQEVAEPADIEIRIDGDGRGGFKTTEVRHPR